jgi:hypothetical protein
LRPIQALRRRNPGKIANKKKLKADNYLIYKHKQTRGKLFLILAFPGHVSTSYAERNNLTMRMNMRRFTRLTNGFSKKLKNLEHAISLHFMYYNFARIHKTLRVTPAMEAGVADHVWDWEEILLLMG